MSQEQIRTAIQGAIEYLSQHPTEARYTDSAATVVLEGGLRCRVVGKNSDTATTDMPASVGGGGSAPSPGWLFRAAQASCVATLVTMHAAVQGVSLTRLEVAVDSESDDRGILGMDESIPAGPISGRIHVVIAAEGVPQDKLRQLVEWADRHCPVTDAVRRAVPLRLEVEVAASKTVR
jgi:uncharacterized OsmC-like protein